MSAFPAQMMPNPTNAVPITITQLDEAVTVVAGYPEANTSYHLAYQAFLRYFADLDFITRHELIIGAHFTYGWMPRILTLHGDLAQLDDAAHILTETKHGQSLTDDELNHWPIWSTTPSSERPSCCTLCAPSVMPCGTVASALFSMAPTSLIAA